MHTKESELKPCPFCGSPGSLFASSDHAGAWEGGCSGEVCVANDLVWDTSKELAVATWNRRASPAEDVRREALEEAAKIAEVEGAQWIIRSEYDCAVAACRNVAAAIRASKETER
jgi:hypothetical protein